VRAKRIHDRSEIRFASKPGYRHIGCDHFSCVQTMREVSPADCLRWLEIYHLSRSVIYRLLRCPHARSRDCLPVSGAQPGL